MSYAKVIKGTRIPVLPIGTPIGLAGLETAEESNLARSSAHKTNGYGETGSPCLIP